SEVKSQIIGTFVSFFGTSLGVLLLKHSDDLSKTLQHSISAMTVTKKANKLELSEPVVPCKRKRPV
uniref:Uncharacterized protein n=1 Tax=Amphimedon queenslandica TaxID=400682 RepID=A0A1X7VSV7_AMPQE